MRVYVDGQEHDVALPDDPTVGTLIDEIRSRVAGTDRLVMAIGADGVDITAEGYAATRSKPAAAFERYDFVTGDPREVVREALGECREILTAAEEERRAGIDLFTCGDTAKGIESLAECCRAWQQIHDAICNALGLLGINPAEFELSGGKLEAALGGAQTQLVQLREALAAQDFVLVSDILEYEFAPLVRTWQTAIDAIHESAASPIHGA